MSDSGAKFSPSHLAQGWKDEASQRDWHLRHSAIHQRIDRAISQNPLSLNGQSIHWDVQSPQVTATGTYLQGDVCFNSTAAVGQPKGWTCTVAGSPGTWVSQGNL